MMAETFGGYAVPEPPYRVTAVCEWCGCDVIGIRLGAPAIPCPSCGYPVACARALISPPSIRYASCKLRIVRDGKTESEVEF